MIQKVQKKIEEFHMILPGDKILVGVSGGIDSIALFLVIQDLSERMGFSLEVVHINHGIRGDESDGDADFVARIAEEYGVPCHMICVDVPAFCEEAGVGIEEGARMLRYERFATLAKERGMKVALAHHMDDNAETILFQLARGSSLNGLCGMQPIREVNGVCYIRPFLSLRRAEIEKFLEQRGQPYRTDSSNMDLDYSRNYIRKKIVPEFSKINQQVVEHINFTASQLLDIKDYLEQEREKALETIWEKVKKGSVLDIPKLLELHKALQQEVVYKVIAETIGGKKDISSKHVEDVLNLCSNQSGKQVLLPKGVIVRREFEKLCFYTEENVSLQEEYIIAKETLERLKHSGEEIHVSLQKEMEKITLRCIKCEENCNEIPQKTYTKWMDYDKIKEGFCIRTRQSGDYIVGDALGHRKKLKQYFIDEKIPTNERNRMWLLVQEHLVLWVVGGRMSEHVKVTDDTETILEITYDGGR